MPIRHPKISQPNFNCNPRSPPIPFPIALPIPLPIDSLTRSTSLEHRQQLISLSTLPPLHPASLPFSSPPRPSLPTPSPFIMSSPAFTSPSLPLYKPAVLSTSISRSPRPTPTPAMTLSSTTRRLFLQSTALSALATLLPSSSQAALRGSTMSGDYKTDAAQILTDMRTAANLTRGAEGMTEKVGRIRKEMNDFVALYRRNNKVSGSTSFSTLYTAINTLSGHYASYGSNYPVPEKRKKRLNQQFSEIDRALNRGR